MKRGAVIAQGVIAALVLALAFSAGDGVAGAQERGIPGNDSVDVDVRVWQHVRDPERIHISARPEGVRWDTLGTIRLLLDDGLSSDRSDRFGDITVEGVEVRVRQHVRDPLRIFISARPVGGDWDVVGTIRLLLDDGHSTSRNYRYGDITVAVPLDTDDAPVVVSPGGEEVPRLAILTIAFRKSPGLTDSSRLVSIDPPVEGSFVWADARRLLFQPDYPGWQRGQQYRVRVDPGRAGLDEAYEHTFTVAGQLEVAHVIPGDGDTGVPANAQLLVQFNRSVAALTVLQEGPAPPVLEFDPPIEGHGEWLNTSLYRFIPDDLQPSTTYSVRVPAGLTSAADGVLESDFTWSFTTSQPAIDRFEPGDGTTFVEPNTLIVVTFNQPMDRASVETGLVLREAEGEAIAGSFEWDEGSTVVTFTPDEPLELSASYQVSASAGLRGAHGGEMPSARGARFETIGLPELVRTSPEDGATDTSPYSVYLYYNNPMDIESFEGRVSVSGIDPEDIELDSYYWRPNEVYVRVQLKPSTTYTVRIAEGVRDRGGRPLPAYEFSFTTRDPRPWLSLAAPASFSTFSASREQVLHYHAARLDDVRFRLYRLSDSEAETLLRRGFIDGWSEVSRSHIEFWPEGGLLRRWSEEIPEDLRETSRLYSTDLSEGEPLPKGHYFLAADAPYFRDGWEHSFVRKLVFSVVDTAIVTKLAFDELVVWALDYDTGEPLDAAPVRAAPLEEAPLSPYATATTDGEGVARLPLLGQQSDSYYSPYGEFLVRVDGEGREGVSSTWWDADSSQWDLGVPTTSYFSGLIAHLYTDRPIYRPGETVHYKGVVRNEDDASYSIPGPGTEVTITVRDPRYDHILNTTAEISELGAISGELVLPADAPIGTYYVWLRADGGGGASARFTVAEFRVPEFEVEVETAGPDYVAGETIPTEARASFFFGGPVADAAVEWTANSSPTVIRVEGYEGYSFSELDYYWWSEEYRYRDPFRSSGEARTDSSGVASFGVPAELEADEGTQRFTISATVTDANAQAIAGSTTVTVHPATWYAGIKPESYIATAGEPETVHLVTVDFERQIAPERPVTVRIYEREWIRTKERASHGGYRYRYEPRDTEILEPQTVTTGQNGEASFSFTPPSAGTYRLVAESTDEEGRVARSARFLWVAGEDYVPWPVREGALELIADREQYEVGGVAEVLVPAPFAGATGLVTIERGRVLSTEVRRFETNSVVLRIPIEDAHIPNIYVGVVLYRPPTEDDPYPRYNVGYVNLSISTEPRRLDVSIQPDRDRAIPGETVQYEVQVTDSEGVGVEADVSVAVVDQAVLSLLDESTRDGLSAFWYERALGVRTASSLGVSIDRGNEAFDEATEGDEGSGNSAAEQKSPTADGGDDNDMAAVAFEAAEESTSDASGPRVRSNFQNTALWIGLLTTDANGSASFELKLPDNATTWRARARAATAETQVGEGESDLLVTQPLLVRPALPRFLRVGDEVTLRTLVRNGTNEARDVRVMIEVEGVLLLDEGIHTVRVEAGDSIVAGWPARVLEDGTATIRFTATTEGYGDAVELSLPVYLDVTPETTATGGVVEDAVAVEAVYLPDYVITGSGSLELSLQASLVGALDQELPFFEPYRWESNVRVASRIVATVAVQRASANGLTEAQESQLRADIDTLITYQNGDGGWGWCRNCYGTDYWVTGWVLIALAEARDAGYTVPDYRNSYFAYLIPDYLNRQTDVERPANPNEHAFLLYALTRALNEGDTPITSIGWGAQLDMLALLEEHRTQLTSWGRAYLALGLLASGHEADHESVRILLNDLSAATIASANGNHWEDDRQPGSMHNSSVRATALVLRALTEVDPSHPLIEETARWLVVARSADRWKTSVERAQGMASLGAFAELTGETRGVYDYQVLLNTRRVLDGHFDVPARDYLDGVALTLDTLPLGEVSRVQFEREAGTEGRLYYGLNLRYVTPATDIEALNRGFAVSHRYSLLDDPETPITSASLGDVVRVTVTVVAPAERLYAKVEDFLPAGLEPIDPRLNIVPAWLREQLQRDQAEARRGSAPSYYAPWYAWYYSPWDQVDLRDDRVTLLAGRLPRGVHEYVYYARATTPGDFFVAPAHAEETYFPEVFGRGDSSRFGVDEAE